MTRPKVLYIAHNHPVVRPGGAEAYAYELYQAMRDGGEVEPLFLARTGPPVSSAPRYHEGTLLASVGDDPNQTFFYTDTLEYDWFHGTSHNKSVYTRHLRDFLLARRPDVVHFQHTLFLGYDAITEVHNALPEAPIVYTLHEFLPICHRNGQLLRVPEEEPCAGESPRRCHECFPDLLPQAFFMRKKFIQSHLANVDVFLAPSRQLLERYVEWGIPREKIRFEDYGRLPVPSVPERQAPPRRTTLGFFGQLSHYKGINVLLEAMLIVGRRDPDVQLFVHGANLDFQPEDFRTEFEALVERCGEAVKIGGPYDHAELANLMARVDWVVVPSIWWENSPLVIQEALVHRRPVICSDIGGMAEKVTDGVDGLHFRANSPQALAETILKAVGEPARWSDLRPSKPNVHDMEQHVATLTQLYRSLLAAESPRPPRRRPRKPAGLAHAG